jgi:hypothetical protein
MSAAAALPLGASATSADANALTIGNGFLIALPT